MHKEIQIFDNKAIAIILGVKNIKMIESRGNLAERLIQKNCRLIEKFKDGRKFMYKVEIIEENNTLTLNEICNKHNIRKTHSFGKHTKNRCNAINGENKLITQQQFANEVKLNKKTIKKYDEILLEEKFMKKNGYRYWAYKDGKLLYETSREAYSNFWAINHAEKTIIDSLTMRLASKEISLEEYRNAFANVIVKLNQKGEVIQRTRNFSKGENFEHIFKELNNL